MHACDAARFEQASQRLNLGAGLDFQTFLSFLSRHVLVIVGPAAKQFWRRQNEEGDESSHVQGLCLFCSAFCLHGTCEHLHAAFLHLKLLSLTVPNFPKKRAQTPVSQKKAPSVHVLMPSQAASSTGTKSTGRPRQPRSAQLRAFLNSLGLIRWEPLLASEEIDVSLLASVPFSELKQAVPTIPSGVLFNLQDKARAWLKDEARASSSKFSTEAFDTTYMFQLLPCT